MSAVQAWWSAFVRLNLVASDPAPEYSPLDRLDGLGRDR